MLGENHVSDLLARPAHVRTAPKHELVTDDAEGEVVDRLRVVLSAHDFGCHVAWRARSVLGVLGLEDLCNAHIRDSHVAIVFHHNVFRLDISVDHALVVHVLEP